MLAYPEAVFAPTDFHSATLVGDEVIVIGCLGYPAQRLTKRTPVYALHIHSLQMRELPCTGDMPGWIHNHRAERCGTHGIEVHGGKRDAGGALQALDGRWRLDLLSCHWQRLA